MVSAEHDKTRHNMNNIIQILLNTKISEIPTELIGFKVVFEVDGYRVVVNKSYHDYSCHAKITVEKIALEEGQGSAVEIHDVRCDVTIGEIYRRARELIESFIRR
jgi:hypothetical protein